jgi:cytochrome P450
MALPPGPRLPRTVQSMGWLFRPGPWLTRQRERYGPAFTIRIVNEPEWVVLSDPDAVRQVFTGDPQALHAGEANAILRPILGARSVLLLDDAEHLAQRKLLLPPFHGERMRRYADLVRTVAEREVAKWPPDAAVEARPRMQAITLEIIMRAIFGVEDPQRLAQLRAALQRLLDWTTDPRRLLLISGLGPRRLQQVPAFRAALEHVHALLDEEIARGRADPRLEGREDILALLLQASHPPDDPDGDGDNGAVALGDARRGTPMSDAEIRDELVTLLVAGHETTATALAWALERLARHPEAWTRLREEVAAGEEAYLDAVIKETLRLRPVLPIVLRLVKRPLEIGGWELPAGVAVVPCIYLVHREPSVYPDPLAFRPERFLETPAGTYSWIPFGGGIRRCLGASFALFEMKTVLRVIAGRARLGPDDPAPARSSRRAITLVPADEARVVVG